MNLSKETLNIFKNFSNINSHLTIKPGNKIITISAQKNIIGDAEVNEQFPVEFGIYDLNEFLGAMSLFDSPNLSFNETYVTISEGKNSVRYYAANQSILTPIPSIKQFPTPDITFDFTNQMLGQVQRVSSILRVTDFSVIGDGNVINILVGDKTNPTANTYTCELGATDKIFKVNMKVENLKIMSGNYTVSIGGKKICRFVNRDQQLTYYVAIELDSSFEI